MDAASPNQVVDGGDQEISSKVTTLDGSGATTQLGAGLVAATSLHGTVIDQLLPQDHQPTWSTSYSIPLYSSFGNHLGAYSDSDSLLETRDDFNDGEHSVAGHISFDNPLGFVSSYQSNKLPSSDCGLIGRPNITNDGDRNIFSSSNFKVNNNPSRSNLNYQQQQQQQQEYLAPARSYSSVLHSPQATPPPMLQRQQQLSNIFSAHEQQHRQITDGLNMNQTGSLIQPTNRQQLQSHQQPPPPQARHLSDYISIINRQRQYHGSGGHHQHSNTIVAGGNFGSIGATLDNRYQHHAQRSTNNNILQRQSINQENKPFPGLSGNAPAKRKTRLPFFSGLSCGAGGSSSGDRGQRPFRFDLYGSALVNSDGGERFSRKVFVGGLPPDIDEEEIKASFRRFGLLIVDWPHKAESKSYFPPKGYAFLLFQEESSVQALIDACLQEDDKLYLCVSSPTIKDKPVQIRPWRLSDADFVLDSTLALDPRKTVFVGGVPRPLKASELATIMNNLYGNVCYAGIDTDPDLKYPKGAGRVAFSNHQSYIAAISARFVLIQHSEIEKRVEVKPYVLDDQFCDECQGARCNNKFAPFFCANIACLRYYCDNCWSTAHSQPGREFHKPLVKEGADRPRVGPGGSGGLSGGRNSGNSGYDSRNSGSSAGGESSTRNQHQSFRC